MSETKHTPGPWRILRQNGKQFIQAGPVYFSIAEVAGPSNAGRERELTANVNLIAAAPDLLEALKMFVREYEGTGSDDRETRPEMIAARAAIAEATGQD